MSYTYCTRIIDAHTSTSCFDRAEHSSLLFFGMFFKARYYINIASSHTMNPESSYNTFDIEMIIKAQIPCDKNESRPEKYWTNDLHQSPPIWRIFFVVCWPSRDAPSSAKINENITLHRHYHKFSAAAVTDVADVEVVANTTKALSHSILASSIAHAIFRCRHIYLRVKLISYSAARPSDTIRGTNWVPNIYQIVLTIIPHSRTLPGYYYIG